MEFEELKRLLKKREINVSDTVEYEYDKYIDRKKYKIEDDLVDIVKAYFPDVRIQFISQIIENCIEQPLKSVSYGRKDVVELDEQLLYAIDDLIRSVEKSKTIINIDSELESNLKQISSSFSFSRLDSCSKEFKEAIRRYFMYRYETPYMSSKQIEISLENMLYDLEKKVVANISTIEGDMKDIINKQYSTFRKMVIDDIEEFRKNNPILESSENMQNVDSKDNNNLNTSVEATSSVSFLDDYKEILEIANVDIVDRNEKIFIRNKSNGYEQELIRLNDYFISADFDIEIASSKDGKKSYSNNAQGISIVMDNSKIIINDTQEEKEIVVADSFDGKEISINGKALINRDEKEEAVRQIYSKYLGLYQYLSHDLQFQKEYDSIMQKIAEERENNYQKNRALFLEDDIFGVKNNNDELLEELREQDRIDDQANRMIDELDKMVEYGESINAGLNMSNDEGYIEELPSNLLL